MSRDYMGRDEFRDEARAKRERSDIDWKEIDRETTRAEQMAALRAENEALRAQLAPRPAQQAGEAVATVYAFMWTLFDGFSIKERRLSFTKDDPFAVVVANSIGNLTSISAPLTLCDDAASPQPADMEKAVEAREIVARSIYEKMEHADGNGNKGSFDEGGFYPCLAYRYADAAITAAAPFLRGVAEPVGLDGTPFDFPVGTQVEKTGGYNFPGEVRSTFLTKSGQRRYVVEATVAGYSGMLHIFSEQQLVLASEAEGQEP